MKQTFSFFLSLIAILFICSCEELILDPTKAEDDPEGTATISLYKDSDKTISGISINDEDMFSGPGWMFSDLGELPGLGNVKNIPLSGWSNSAGVMKNHGYVAMHYDNGQPVFLRIFVSNLAKDEMGTTTGYQLKFAKDFKGSETVPVPADSAIYVNDEGGVFTVKMKNSSFVPFTARCKHEWIDSISVNYPFDSTDDYSVTFRVKPSSSTAAESDSLILATPDNEFAYIGVFRNEQAPWTATTSIADFKKKYFQLGGDQIVNEETIIRGRVISTDEAVNTPTRLVVDDGTAAISIIIYRSKLYQTFPFGQEVTFNLTGHNVYAGNYTVRVDDAHTSNYTGPTKYRFQRIGKPEPEKVTKISTSPAELHTAIADRLTAVMWDSRYVTLPAVTFSKPNTSLADSQEVIDITTKAITFQVSSKSTFASKIAPSGVGRIDGLFSALSTKTLLLYPISDDDFGWFDSRRHFGKGTEESPISIAQITAANFLNRSVWVSGYIVGAVAPGLNSVESNSDIDWGKNITLDNTLVIADSANCRDFRGCAIVKLPEGSQLRHFGNLVNNPSNLGKSLTLCSSIDNSLGIYTITHTAPFNFTIGSKSYVGGTYGEGTQTKPYSVEEVIAMAPESSSSTEKPGVWVYGYIVGFMRDLGTPVFGVDYAVTTNILLASDPNTTDASKCIPVQLPPTAIRDALNLSSRPSNIWKRCSVKGDVMKYFDRPGIKNTSEYTLY